MALPTPLTALGRFVAKYSFWIASLAVFNVAIWIGAERVYLPRLWVHQEALWPVRMYLASGLLLFDNLCVLWWYADQTHRLAEVAEGQLQFQVSQWRVANKPIVFLDAEVASGGSVHYVAHNVGTGLAVNVHEVQLRETEWSIASIGAIEPRGRRHLRPSVEDPLRDHYGKMPGRILATEAVKSRTQQWIVTLNVLDRAGGVRHMWIADLDPKREMTLVELLNEYGSSFQDKLAGFHFEVAGS